MTAPGKIRCPNAPACSGQMVRHSIPASRWSQAGTELRCWNWPDCDQTMPIPEAVKLREAGAPDLGLFDPADTYRSEGPA